MSLGLILLIVGAVLLSATLWCIAGFTLLTVMEWIERFMKRYFPQKYYYDWDEEA